MIERWISTTIKKVWLDKILSGEKKIEYKDNTEWWRARLGNIDDLDIDEGVGINFLCGRKHYKFMVTAIHLVISGTPKDIDGNECFTWYEIHLGERYFPKCRHGKEIAWDNGCPYCTPDDDCTSSLKCEFVFNGQCDMLPPVNGCGLPDS